MVIFVPCSTLPLFLSVHVDSLQAQEHPLVLHQFALRHCLVFVYNLFQEEKMVDFISSHELECFKWYHKRLIGVHYMHRLQFFIFEFPNEYENCLCPPMKLNRPERNLKWCVLFFTTLIVLILSFCTFFCRHQYPNMFWKVNFPHWIYFSGPWTMEKMSVLEKLCPKIENKVILESECFEQLAKRVWHKEGWVWQTKLDLLGD